VATIHTTPFEKGETIDDTALVRQFLEESDEYDLADYDVNNLARNGALTYDGDPSAPGEDKEGGDFEAAAQSEVKGYLIDGSNVFSYDNVRGVDEATDRCGY